MNLSKIIQAIRTGGFSLRKPVETKKSFIEPIPPEAKAFVREGIANGQGGFILNEDWAKMTQEEKAEFFAVKRGRSHGRI